MRNYTVDLAKIFAAFGVVAIHVHFSTSAAENFGNFFSPLCVPFFYVVSLTYFVSALNSTSVSLIFSRLWTRIIIPYLAWTFIYTGLLLFKNFLSRANHTFNFWKILFYGESTEHLYYLPELVIMQVLLLSLFLLFSSNIKGRAIGLLLLRIAGGYIYLGYINNCFGVPAVRYIFAYGICAFLFKDHINKVTFGWQYTLGGVVLIVLAISSHLLRNSYSLTAYASFFPIGGIGLLLLSIGIPINSSSLSDRVGKLSSSTYGIYLSHILFLEAFEFVVEKKFPSLIEYNLLFKIIIATLIFVIAAIFTFYIKRIPIGRQILLGEKR